MGYPSFFAQFLAFAFILVPIELGFLLYQGKKKTGRFTLRGIISYQRSIPWWQYFLWVTIIFVIVGALMTLFKPVDSFLHEEFIFLDAGCKYRIGWYLFQNNIDCHLFGVIDNRSVFGSNG